MTATQPDEQAAETDLVTRLRAGDGGAYETAFCTHSGAMQAVARRYLGDTSEAADAAQDAFVSALRGMPGFTGTSRLGTWLHRVTANACLMRLRARRRCRTVPLEESTLAGRRPPDRGEHPACGLARAETIARVRACVDRLPATYRDVIRLRDLEEFDTDETAARLGTNPGVVKTRLHRARHALRTLLEAAHAGAV